MPESIWQQEKNPSLCFFPFNVQNTLLNFSPQTLTENFSRHSQPHVNKRWVHGLVQLKDFYNFYNENLQETKKIGNSPNNLIEGKKQTGG